LPTGCRTPTPPILESGFPYAESADSQEDGSSMLNVMLHAVKNKRIFTESGEAPEGYFFFEK